jgi:hypothetical protein
MDAPMASQIFKLATDQHGFAQTNQEALKTETETIVFLRSWFLTNVSWIPVSEITIAMKGNVTKRRYKAQKRSACAMCKPYKRGWEDKKTARDLRAAIQHEQQLKEYCRA